MLAVLFPVVLGDFWSAGDEGAQVTRRLTAVNSIASVAVFLLAPVLGAIADSGGYRKRFQLLFVLLGAFATAGLALVGEGGWPAALALFLFGSIGFYGANVFYDSLIFDVVRPRYYSALSATGFALGYVGSAMLLMLHLVLLRSPETFGLSGTEAATQVVFVSCGLWWILFVLPLMLLVKERRRGVAVGVGVVAHAWASLRDTFLKIREHREALRFLGAYFVYIGGVFTVVVMGVNFGQRLGFDTEDLIMAVLITNFAGFPATLAYAWFGHRLGPRRTLLFGLGVYVAVVCWAVFLDDVREFYLMAVAVGAVQGGVQGMSRSLYAGLIPPDRAGEFFGFYNTLTKLAHALGSALVGLGALVSDNPKFILVPLLPLFIGGAALLWRVREPAALRG